MSSYDCVSIKNKGYILYMRYNFAKYHVKLLCLYTHNKTGASMPMVDALFPCYSMPTFFLYLFYYAVQTLWQTYYYVLSQTHFYCWQQHLIQGCVFFFLQNNLTVLCFSRLQGPREINLNVLPLMCYRVHISPQPVQPYIV